MSLSDEYQKQLREFMEGMGNLNKKEKRLFPKKEYLESKDMFPIQKAIDEEVSKLT